LSWDEWLRRASSTLLLILLVVLMVPPILWLVFGSFVTGVPWNPKEYTLLNYFRVLTETRTLTALSNSIIISLGHTLLAIFIAFWLAWVTTRTNAPLRHIVEPLMPLTLLMPGFLVAIVWILLLSPSIGLVNTLILPNLGMRGIILNVYTLEGIIWVMGVYGVPIAYLMIAPALKNVDQSLEEASKILGAGNFTTLRRITFPLLKPAFLSTFLLLFMLGIESFDIPLYIGGQKIPVLTTEIFVRMKMYLPRDYGGATSIAMVTLLLTLLLVYLQRRALREEYRFVTITGKGYRPALVDLGRWKYLVSLSVILLMLILVFAPLAILVIVSLFKRYPFSQLNDFTTESYCNVWSYPLVQTAFINSFIIGVIAATLAMILALFTSYYLVRTKARLKTVVESLAMLGIAVPGIVLSLGFLWAYVGTPIYNTIWILIIASLAKRISWGVRFTIGGMMQIHPELEECAKVLGSSWIHTFFRIICGIGKGWIIGGWLVILLLVIRELAIPVILYTYGTEVISIIIYDMWDHGLYLETCALSVILITIIAIVVIFIRKVLKIGITV